MHAIASRVARWVGPENPERVVYGVILIGALLAAESGLHDSYPDTIGSAVIALGIYWLAHSYATVLGRRLAAAERLTARSLGRALAHEWAIVRGASIPLVPLLVAWAVGAPHATAVTVAVWTAVASILAFELLAGLTARATTSEIALEASVGVAMGVAILALKALAH